MPSPGTARFCASCGRPLVDGPAGSVPTPVAATAAPPSVPSAIPDPGRGPAPEEERRLVTALFADLSGFTALASRLDAEDLLEVMDPLLGELSEIVVRYGGYIEKFAGDALLALFGAPVAHEDDAARAIRAASDMHRVAAAPGRPAGRGCSPCTSG